MIAEGMLEGSKIRLQGTVDSRQPARLRNAPRNSCETYLARVFRTTRPRLFSGIRCCGPRLKISIRSPTAFCKSPSAQNTGLEKTTTDDFGYELRLPATCVGAGHHGTHGDQQRVTSIDSRECGVCLIFGHLLIRSVGISVVECEASRDSSTPGTRFNHGCSRTSLAAKRRAIRPTRVLARLEYVRRATQVRRIRWLRRLASSGRLGWTRCPPSPTDRGDGQSARCGDFRSRSNADPATQQLSSATEDCRGNVR